MELQNQLANRVEELEEALGRVKTLQGLLPICSYCKKIRDDGNYWKQVEGYIEDHADVSFSHGISIISRGDPVYRSFVILTAP